MKRRDFLARSAACSLASWTGRAIINDRVDGHMPFKFIREITKACKAALQ
jgi:hypothetical protein